MNKSATGTKYLAPKFCEPLPSSPTYPEKVRKMPPKHKKEKLSLGKRQTMLHEISIYVASLLFSLQTSFANRILDFYLLHSSSTHNVPDLSTYIQRCRFCPEELTIKDKHTKVLKNSQQSWIISNSCPIYTAIIT